MACALNTRALGHTLTVYCVPDQDYFEELTLGYPQAVCDSCRMLIFLSVVGECLSPFRVSTFIEIELDIVSYTCLVDGFSMTVSVCRGGLVCEHTRSPHLMDYTYTGQELLSIPNGTEKPMWAVNRCNASCLCCCDWYSEGCMGRNCRSNVSTRMYFYQLLLVSCIHCQDPCCDWLTSCFCLNWCFSQYVMAVRARSTSLIGCDALAFWGGGFTITRACTKRTRWIESKTTDTYILVSKLVSRLICETRKQLIITLQHFTSFVHIQNNEKIKPKFTNSSCVDSFQCATVARENK